MNYFFFSFDMESTERKKNIFCNSNLTTSNATKTVAIYVSTHGAPRASNPLPIIIKRSLGHYFY